MKFPFPNFERDTLSYLQRPEYLAIKWQELILLPLTLFLILGSLTMKSFRHARF